MTKLPRLVFALLAFSLLVGSRSLAASPSASLVGVWKMVSSRDVTAGTSEDPGNMHYVFTPGYLMVLGGGENRPKIHQNFAKMTDAELRSQLPLGGGFMSYKIIDGKIHRTTIFALSAVYEGETIVTDYTVTGDTLVLSDHHFADGHTREWRFTRVE